MENKLKKQALFICAFFLLASTFSNAAFAQEESKSQSVETTQAPAKKTCPWKFSLEGNLGFRFGVYDEIVWAKRKSDGEQYKQSELNYNIKPIFYTGINFNAEYKRLGLSFLSKFFFTQEAGNLVDSDWRNDSFCSNGDTSTLTDYSKHDLYLENRFLVFSGYDLEIQGDFKFHPTHFLTLAPLLSFNAKFMSFYAKDGIGYYGTYDALSNTIRTCTDISTRMIYSFDGNRVIEYDVHNLFLWTGLKACFNPIKFLRFELASEVSLLSLLLDHDRHLTNNKEFKEISLSAFYAFRQSLKTEFKIKDFISICQTCIFTFTGESVGTMFYKTTSDPSFYRLTNNNGGGQIICLDIELSVKFYW